MAAGSARLVRSRRCRPSGSGRPSSGEEGRDGPRTGTTGKSSAGALRTRGTSGSGALRQWAGLSVLKGQEQGLRPGRGGWREGGKEEEAPAGAPRPGAGRSVGPHRTAPYLTSAVVPNDAAGRARKEPRRGRSGAQPRGAVSVPAERSSPHLRLGGGGWARSGVGWAVEAPCPPRPRPRRPAWGAGASSAGLVGRPRILPAAARGRAWPRGSAACSEGRCGLPPASLRSPVGLEAPAREPLTGVRQFLRCPGSASPEEGGLWCGGARREYRPVTYRCSAAFLGSCLSGCDLSRFIPSIVLSSEIKTSNVFFRYT